MNDNWQAGHELMVKMMGPEFAKASEANAESGAFAADVARMAIEHAVGGVWARPGLALKYRRAVVIGALIAQHQPDELKNHLRFGLNNGLTVLEIQEIIIQTLPYVGFPAVSSALGATIEVLRERGLDDQVLKANETGLL
ncbi:4-carboxymuconolactone decarboxylase [Pseudomonas sp. CG7]|uniref:carboxymuconolactone decarboxylase family protein n=1 Tax=Pseudomonas sp. CG7 TaxID=191007 RepID=UPI00203385AB|nr:carboxymuconolactone decarboxylase family protein [Pseudomonas sp. CG7]MCM2459399.1 4-carboxymuconolactone decarboxylase [Pseudomonas sp. CG7]